LLLAAKAVELDSSDPQAYWALAMTNMWNRNLDRAIVEIEKAVALDPNNSQAIGTRGYILSYADRAPEAIASLEKSMRLNPQYPNIYLHFLAHAYFVDGDYEQAVALLRRRIRLHPETDISRVLLASCCGHLGREDEAREAWTGVFKINPDYSIDKKARVIPYQNPADWDRFVAGLNKAGLPV
jgi:adenylate cyclase